MIILILLISLMASPALSATWYVSTSGSDSNDGTASDAGHAWRNPQKCADSAASTGMANGDTCEIADGTYSDPNSGSAASNGHYVVVHSGSAPLNITMKATNRLGVTFTMPSASTSANRAIYILRTGWTIDGIIITGDGNGSSSSSNTGILIQADNTTVQYMKFDNIARGLCMQSSFSNAGISVQASNALIQYNQFSRLGRLRNTENGCSTSFFQHDHAIYYLSGSGGTIKYNLFWNVYSGFSIQFFKSGGGTYTNINVYNNTFVGRWAATNTPSGQIVITGTTTNMNIRNNISSDAPGGFFIKWVAPIATTNLVITHNMGDGADADLQNSSERPTSGITSNNNTAGATLGFTSAGTNDYTLTSSSQALEAGINVGLPYNGSAPTIGVFQPFKFSSCQVPNGAASTIQITFSNNVFPPIGSTITTFTARKNGASNALTGAATKVGDNIASLPLTNSYAGGDTADISWSTGGLTDSAKIGGSQNQPFIQTLSNQSCTNNAGGAPTYTFTQSRFEFHDQYGSETAPVMLPYGYANSGAAENFSSLKVQVGGAVRIRFSIVCGTSNCDPTGFNLYYSTGGAYAAIPDSFDSGNIKFCGAPTDANSPANGAATTDQLSTAGTFVAGGVIYTASAIPTISGLNTNFKTELEYCVMFDSDASGNYDFRVYKQSGTALDTYTVTPRVVIQATAAGGSGF